MKATMMKVSDPVIFGHAVKVYYKAVFDKYGQLFDQLGVDVNNGLGDVYAKIQSLPEAQRAEIEAAIQAVYATQPALAMVDSDRGITNLHVPSDVIVDASMPAMIVLQAKCGALMVSRKTPKRRFPIAATQAFTKPSSISVNSTARLTQLLWAVCPTWV